jgi:hypothetical protein
MSTTTDDGDAASWHRRFGSGANNRAWELAEQPTRTAAEDDAMLHAAHAAFYHWHTIGTERNVALAHLLLGHVHASLQDGTRARAYADAAFAFFATNASEPWEKAFAHAVLAHAAAACGDAEAHRAHYREAQALGGALDDAEERKIFDATFAVIPPP